MAGKVYLDWLHPQYDFPCRLLGPSRELGHKLRSAYIEPDPANVTQKSSTSLTIIGGGIAGLSAGWWLKKHGINDFEILELEKSVGGNSISGSNQYSAYPWGAHYVPLPNAETEYVRMLFEELKIIQGYDKSSGLPIFDELMLCHEPQERLFKDGAFQEGLVPKRGMQKEEASELGHFFQMMHRLKHAKGSDGKPAFAIPLDLSSTDEQFRKWDKISMRAWMKENGFRSKPLIWYVNYCCRDDYGSSIDNVSAWAGVHYYAGRRGRAANAEPESVITWPEGNGHLVNRLKEILADHLRTSCLVARVKQVDGAVQTLYLQPDSGKMGMSEAKCAIFAAPRFVAKHIVNEIQAQEMQSLQYAPWMVANITLKSPPHGRGADLAWDNVSYYSDSLGYVVANHQDVTTRETYTVITYYYPLSANQPSESRKQLYDAQPRRWSAQIVEDLEKMNPGIGSQIVSMDLWPWGHGMIQPSVGFMWSERRAKMTEPLGKIFFAHSDMSGMSNFEEAQYRGVEAAKSALALLGA
jgi:hypothetical protein